MRKVFVTMLLAVTLIFIGSQAEAREVYVGSYSDGTAVYLMTETISKNYSKSRFRYTCTVRAGGNYLNYIFEGDRNMDDMSTTYRNSEGYSGRVYDGSSPVAAAICNYCLSH